MISSMTAFAQAEITQDDMRVAVEIRTYNSKALDISLRLSPGWQPLEEPVKRCIAQSVSRGRVEIAIQITDNGEHAAAYAVDAAKAMAYQNALRTLSDLLEGDGRIPFELIAAVPGVIRPAEKTRDPDAAWTVLAACLNDALAQLTAMRHTEGAFLAEDLNTRLDFVETALEEITAAAADLPAHYRQRLTERITALTEGQAALDPGRLAQEAALLADRSDISEEIVRARSHAAQFRSIMASHEPAGRKLNFLLQEFNREFNTMGSKAGNAGISHAIVAVKSELEKMREQVQNVE